MDYSKVLSTWWFGTCYHKQQLDEIITSTDIKNYAYILHDKDKQPNSEELKKPHYHFLVQFGRTQRGSWFKAFASDDMGLVFVQRCTIPKAAYDYLIHDTPASKKDGKYLYDPAERVSTIQNFDNEEKEIEDENLMLFADVVSLVNKEISWYDLLKKKPKRIHMISNIKTAYDLLIGEDRLKQETVRRENLKKIYENSQKYNNLKNKESYKQMELKELSKEDLKDFPFK